MAGGEKHQLGEFDENEEVVRTRQSTYVREKKKELLISSVNIFHLIFFQFSPFFRLFPSRYVYACLRLAFRNLLPLRTILRTLFQLYLLSTYAYFLLSFFLSEHCLSVCLSQKRNLLHGSVSQTQFVLLNQTFYIFFSSS